VVGVAEVAVVAGIAGVVHLVLHRLTRCERIGGADEGYLWYGIQELRRGKVPVRDFRSYEPGRYWWTGSFTVAFRSEFVAVRVAGTSFLALAAALLGVVLLAAGSSWLVVTVAIVVPALWGFRHNKRLDQGVVLLVAAASIELLRSPDLTSSATVGLMAGVALTMGANHGLYAVVAGSVAGLVAVRSPGLGLPDAIFGGILGVAVGSVPLAGFALVNRGFVSAFVERRFREPRRRGTTNLPLPYAWLGSQREVRPAGGVPRLTKFVTKALLTVVPAAALAALAIGFIESSGWVSANAPLVGGGITTLVYWHHVASRADMGHLSTVIVVPLAVVPATVVSPWAVCVVAVGVVGVSLLVAIPMHDRWRRFRHPSNYVQAASPSCSGIWFTRGEAALVDVCVDLDRSIASDEPWIAVPMTMWILPIVRRRSAVYQSFCVYPASAADEDAMLAEIAQQRPPVAIIGMGSIDGRSDRCFKRTHPVVWASILGDYVLDEQRSVPGIEVRIRSDHAEAEST